MKKFHFPLETLLKVRKERVKAQQKLLMQKEKECYELQEKVSSLQRQILGQKREEGSFLQQRRYINYLVKEEQDLQEKMSAKQNERKFYQKEVTARLKERKVIEKIRENEYARWHVANHKEEIRLF